MSASGIAFVFVAIFVGVALFFLFSSASTKHPDERGKIALFQFRTAFIAGTALLKSASALPVMRVALYNDFLVIGLLRPWKIQYRDIASIKEQPLNAIELKVKGMRSKTTFICPNTEVTKFIVQKVKQS